MPAVTHLREGGRPSGRRNPERDRERCRYRCGFWFRTDGIRHRRHRSRLRLGLSQLRPGARPEHSAVFSLWQPGPRAGRADLRGARARSGNAELVRGCEAVSADSRRDGSYRRAVRDGNRSPSILPGIGPPSPPDAPGEGTEAAGIDLEATEGRFTIDSRTNGSHRSREHTTTDSRRTRSIKTAGSSRWSSTIESPRP